MTRCSQRCGSGSTPECLPKKLSSSAVASAVWLSVLPIIPNLNGLTPSSCWSFNSTLRAERAYSYCNISFFFSSEPSKLDRSQVS